MNVPLVLLSSCHLIIVPKWPFCLVSLKASLSGFIPHVPFLCVAKNAAVPQGSFGGTFRQCRGPISTAACEEGLVQSRGISKVLYLVPLSPLEGSHLL